MEWVEEAVVIRKLEVASEAWPFATIFGRGQLMISLFISNTDNAWFDFLSSEADLAEVNFWSPGETNF